MRKNIFEKAKYLLDNKLVKILGESDHSISFQVNKYNVTAKYKNHKLIWLCDCKAEVGNVLCSHKIAAQVYLVNIPKEFFDHKKVKPFKISIPKSIQIGLKKLTPRQKYILRQMVCFRCQDCKKHEREVGTLEPHRITRGADGGLYIPQNIKMLCKKCHDNYDY